jgi:hypothetical protein
VDSDETRLEIQKDYKNSFAGRWGWYLVINKLTNDDITKHDAILSCTLVQALNQLAFLLAKDEELKRQMKNSGV